MRRLAPLLLVAAARVATAGTLAVGPGQPYATIAAAAAAAHDGDTVEIAAGTYHEAVTWTANQLTVRGVGGRPVIDLTGMPIGNGKAIFVSAGADATFENLEFVGAAVTDQNGAGIRWEGAGTFTVRDSIFRSNEDGILGGGGAHPENTATIERNEFVDNGRGDVGYTHNVYLGDAASVMFRGNWSHALWAGGADVGHLFKCRAHRTYVIANRLTAEANPSSYEINLPQGGEAYVIGNVIQQRAGGQRIMISFADGDGTQYPGSKLVVVANTFVSESAGPATFVRTTLADAQLTLIDNLVVGDGTLASGGVIAAMDHDLATMAPGFVDAAGFDYHLTAGSPAIDVGGDPGANAPTEQYVHPTATEARAVVGAAIDVGAFEFGNAGGPPGDAGPTPGAGAAPGGCCAIDDGPPPLAAILVVAARYLRKRRTRSRTSVAGAGAVFVVGSR